MLQLATIIFAQLTADLSQFSPRQGEPSTDEVRLRGDAKLVTKLKAELEKMVAALRDRIILAVEIPVAHHGALIGRGGQNLNDMQNKYNVQIQIPGSRSYNQVGEPENLSDFTGVDTSNLVKVSGPRIACEKVIAELKVYDFFSHHSLNSYVLRATSSHTALKEVSPARFQFL